MESSLGTVSHPEWRCTIRRSPREWTRQVWESAHFRVRPPNWNAVLEDQLPFGSAGNSAFCALVGGGGRYLEFGSGSSTLWAVKRDVPTVSVESDLNFMAAVQKRAQSEQLSVKPSSIVFVHGDIGPTGPWGKPLFPMFARPNRWIQYPMAPWKHLGPDFRAEVILLDGRFRVACALAVALMQPDVSWSLLVDDYVDRDHYKSISAFASLRGTHGRMVEFGPKAGISKIEVERALRHFAADWR